MKICSYYNWSVYAFFLLPKILLTQKKIRITKINSPFSLFLSLTPPVLAWLFSELAGVVFRVADVVSVKTRSNNVISKMHLNWFLCLKYQNRTIFVELVIYKSSLSVYKTNTILYLQKHLKPYMQPLIKLANPTFYIFSPYAFQNEFSHCILLNGIHNARDSGWAKTIPSNSSYIRTAHVTTHVIQTWTGFHGSQTWKAMHEWDEPREEFCHAI